jgi:hypothetical protein
MQGWCFVNGFSQNTLWTQFAATILFTDEVGFTRDSTVNFHITYVVSLPYVPPWPITGPA